MSGRARQRVIAGSAGVALAAAIWIGRAGADPPDFELRVPDEVALDLGAAGAISLTIVPDGDHTISHDGPIRVELQIDDGVAIPRRRYGRKDAADPAAEVPRFDLKLKALAPGDHALAIDARFWLCGRKVCRPIRATRTVMVHVAAPPPPDAAPAPDATPDAAPPPDARRRR